MNRVGKWIFLSSLLLPGVALPTDGAASQPSEQAMVTCYPKAQPGGAHVVVSREGAGHFRLSVLGRGAELLEVAGSGKDYGDGRVQIDVPAQGKRSALSLSIGNQFVFDSTIGNYS